MHFPRPSLLASVRGLGSIGVATMAATIVVACSSSSSPSNTSSNEDSGTPVTFTEIYTDIISQICVACHIPGGTGVTVGMLDMSTQALAYANLVGEDGGAGVEAAGTPNGCVGKGLRVVPGNFHESILAEKVDPTLFSSLNCGLLMPQGGQLTSAQIQSIESWISEGAKND
jgi:hypothetical protein